MNPRHPIESTRRKRRSRRGASALAIVIVGTALALAACGGQPAGEGEQPAVPVTVGKVMRQAVPIELSSVGTVEAAKSVDVRSQVAGEIRAVHFDEGDEVAKGQLLFTIDPRPFQAALAQAKAQLARDQALAANAKAEVARYAELVKKDYVTPSQFDQVKANAESLGATVAADEAAVDNARVQLGYTSIESPIDGRTGSLLVHAGNVVKANDQTLVVVQQISPIRVRFSVPQRYLGEIRRRAPDNLQAVAAIPDAPGESYRGTLSFVDNAVDTTTGTIGLKAVFPNRDRALWPGQFVDVALTLGTEEDAVVAPAEAIESGQEGDYVFVVRPDETVTSQSVKVAREIGGKAVIAEGLEGGETVVTDGQLRLTPGAKIEVKKQAPAEQGEEEPS